MDPESRKFVHRHTTRMIPLLVLALLFACAGIVILAGAIYLTAWKGWETGRIVMFLAGGMMAFGGIYYVIRYFFPLEMVSEITDERIVCRRNGTVRFDIRRDDMRVVEISVGSIETLYVEMKDGRRIRIPPAYFWDFEKLHQHLRLCDYRVAE